MYYAVKKGRETGIFTSWKECERAINGYKDAKFKKFLKHSHAVDFMNDNHNNLNKKLTGLHIYVDGSYSEKTGYAGYGIVYIYNGEVIDSQSGRTKKYIDMRNIAGELIGAGIGIKWAAEKGYKEIYLHYDYVGIERWATGSWKCKQEGTVNYKKFIDRYTGKIKINFIKVKSHSGDYYNDMADKLAASCLNIQ